MVLMTGLCIAFLYQHNSISPFQVTKSNHVEGLSLALLIVVSVINLLKASLTDSGVVPTGPSVLFFKSLELSEKLFVLLIISYILGIELNVLKICRKPRCRIPGRSGIYKVNDCKNPNDHTESTYL